MKIIGHRGARGEETENTLESLRAGAASGADRIEFDVWTSQDGVPILLHDADFNYIAGDKRRVFDLTFDQIKKIRTHDGKKIITARQALRALEKTPVYFEIKDYYLSDGVLKVLDEFKGHDIWIGSNNHKVIYELREKRPRLTLFAATVWRPVETLHFIRKNKIQGLSLNYKWFNLLIYLYCRHNGIKVMLYTVNNKWLIRHYKRFYPSLYICTDYPKRAVELARSQK